MSLKDEVKEAMAGALEEHKFLSSARSVRDDERKRYPLSVAAQAALSVCDEYEEVGVQAAFSGKALRLRENPYWDYDRPSFTVYRKKQKPEPDVTELARRAVKAWRSPAPVFGAAMEALAEAVDK